MFLDSNRVLIILSTVWAASSYAGERDFTYEGRTYTYDEAMRMDEPPAGLKQQVGVEGCEDRVESTLGVPFRLFELLTQNEGGEHGMATYSVSKDGRHKSWDVGKYQINEINWSQYEGIPLMTPFHLRWNDCSNLIAAAFRLKPFYGEAKNAFKRYYGSGNVDAAMDQALYALAGYNSETPEIRAAYSARLKAHLMRYMLEGRSVVLW